MFGIQKIANIKMLEVRRNIPSYRKRIKNLKEGPMRLLRVDSLVTRRNRSTDVLWGDDTGEVMAKITNPDQGNLRELSANGPREGHMNFVYHNIARQFE